MIDRPTVFKATVFPPVFGPVMIICRIEPPKEINIPINIDLGTLLGTPTDKFQTSNTQVSTVTYKNGRVYYNGQPLQNQQQAKIAAACQKRNKKRR